MMPAALLTGCENGSQHDGENNHARGDGHGIAGETARHARPIAASDAPGRQPGQFLAQITAVRLIVEEIQLVRGYRN